MRVCARVSQLLLLSLARAEESPGMNVQPRVTTTVWFVKIRMSFSELWALVPAVAATCSSGQISHHVGRARVGN